MTAAVEKLTAGVAVGSVMALSGSWESFAMLGAAGGLIGHVIWCERNPEKAEPLNGRQHAAKIARNMVVSAFNGVMIFLFALQLGFNKEPAAYFVAGVFGLFSIDAAVFMLEAAKDVVKTLAGRVANGGGKS